MLNNRRKGQVLYIKVPDYFYGKVKILGDYFYKWFIEIIDITMCRPDQTNLKQGERIWVFKRDIEEVLNPM